MKWLLLCIGLSAIALSSTGADAASAPAKHKIVFEFVSAGAEQREAVLNNVQNVTQALGGDTELLVVAHGPGLELLLKTNKTESIRIGKLISDKVVFAACENTLRRKNIPRDELLPGVITVDSGVAEVVRKQEAGWAYIKSGH